jgi:anti-sigma B factor antagonist
MHEPSELFHIDGQDDRGRLVVSAYGELDFVSCGELEETLTRLIRAGDEVVLDVAAVPFVDSTGIAALVTAARRAREAGSSFRVTNPQPQAMRMFELTGVAELLGVSPGTPAA